MPFMELLLTTLLCSTLFLAFKLFKLKKKFSKIIDIEIEFEKIKNQKKSTEIEFKELSEKLINIQREIGILNDTIEFSQSGIIKLQYNFNSSKEYEERLDQIRDVQKELVKNDKAIYCPTAWEVGGSKSEGKKMLNRLKKLALNAFNSQCDNVILNVSYSNFSRSKEKITKLEEVIEKLLEVNQCTFTAEYIDLKYKELELVFGYQEKLQEEKEEQKRIRVQMQEEEKVRREIEKAKFEAEKEEEYFEKALDKARKELEKKKDSDKEIFLLKIKELETQLQEAHMKKERAMSQAEQTKRGHVYIISNIGSFGEHTFKIGMTRRLDPLDRIYELGDASVPFDFDVHAMIYSEDAPALENTLHKLFNGKRINLVNIRKEFFKTSIDEIENACRELKINIKFTKIAEAKEYRQSIEQNMNKVA